MALLCPLAIRHSYVSTSFPFLALCTFDIHTLIPGFLYTATESDIYGNKCWGEGGELNHNVLATIIYTKSACALLKVVLE